MAFKAKKEEQVCMAEGNYEVIVVDCKEKTTDQGYELISFDFKIRDDVEQAYKRKRFFKSFYREQDGSLSEETEKKLCVLAHNLGIPDGSDFDLPDLIGKCCILHIGPYTNPNTGLTKDALMYSKPTEVGQAIDAPQGFTDVSETEEVPF